MKKTENLLKKFINELHELTRINILLFSFIFIRSYSRSFVDKYSLTVLLLAVTVLFCGCRQKAPVIHSVDPKIGNLGEPLIVHGANFGSERGESFVTIAGTRPTGSSYQLWQDDKIVFKVPEFG
jgi:hypothetical protein